VYPQQQRIRQPLLESTAVKRRSLLPCATRVLFLYNQSGITRMHTANLRKVGGSVMLALPPAILDLLNLKAGATVGIEVDDGRLVIAPRKRPRYTLDELLAASDYTQPQSPEDREWVDAPSSGREPL
jgi:antitoxin ChpS